MIEMIPVRGLFTTLIAAFAMSAVVAAEQSPLGMSEGVLENVERGTDRGVPWLSGGVGEDERKAIMAAASGYNLKLEFANTDGSYLSDVDVLIRNAEGETVLNVVSSGPWLMTELPAGDYRVHARFGERTLAEAVSLSRQHVQTIVFNRWSTAETSAPPR